MRTSLPFPQKKANPALVVIRERVPFTRLNDCDIVVLQEAFHARPDRDSDPTPYNVAFDALAPGVEPPVECYSIPLRTLEGEDARVCYGVETLLKRGPARPSDPAPHLVFGRDTQGDTPHLYQMTRREEPRGIEINPLPYAEASLAKLLLNMSNEERVRTMRYISHE